MFSLGTRLTFVSIVTNHTRGVDPADTPIRSTGVEYLYALKLDK